MQTANYGSYKCFVSNLIGDLSGNYHKQNVKIVIDSLNIQRYEVNHEYIPGRIF